MQNLIPFDPTQATSNSFVAHLPNGGWLLVINESVVGLQLFFPSTGFKSTVPPYCMRMMRLTIPIERVEWSQAYLVTGGQSPLNTVVGEVYEQSEWSGGEFLIPLPRLVNIGNQVSTTSSQTLVNDGAAAGSPFIEATAAPSSGSNVKVLNDGTVIISVLSNGSYVPVLQITPGGASTPAVVLMANGLSTKGALSLDNAAIKTDGAGNVTLVGAVTGGPFHGTADAANNVPASGVGLGNLANGVFLAGAVTGLLTAGTPNLCRLFTPQVASQKYQFLVVTWDGTTGHTSLLVDETGKRFSDTVPATGVTAGALPSGVTIPGGQVSSTVAKASALTLATPSTVADLTLADDGVNHLTVLQTAQPAASARGLGVIVWDGAASHGLTLLDGNGNFIPAVPGANVTGTVANATSATQIDATHANSNTPQIKADANVGISTQNTTVSTRRYAALMPTEADATVTGLAFGYTDAAGAYHAQIGSDASAGLRFLSSGAIYRAGSFFSGTGAGTFAHGFPGTPSYVGITSTVVNSTETVGVDTIGSANVHVNQGTGGFTWIGTTGG